MRQLLPPAGPGRHLTAQSFVLHASLGHRLYFGLGLNILLVLRVLGEGGRRVPDSLLRLPEDAFRGLSAVLSRGVDGDEVNDAEGSLVRTVDLRFASGSRNLPDNFCISAIIGRFTSRSSCRSSAGKRSEKPRSSRCSWICSRCMSERSLRNAASASVTSDVGGPPLGGVRRKLGDACGVVDLSGASTASEGKSAMARAATAVGPSG